MVVSQLVEGSVPTPEIRHSNPNISKVLSTYFKLNRKDDNKEKEAEKGPLKKMKANIELIMLSVQRVQAPFYPCNTIKEIL